MTGKGPVISSPPVLVSLPEIGVDLPNDDKQLFAKHLVNGISLWSWFADAA